MILLTQIRLCTNSSMNVFSVTQSLFFLGFLWSSDNITACNKKNPSRKRAYQCIWNNYAIFAQIYNNSTTLSMWVVYTSWFSQVLESPGKSWKVVNFYKKSWKSPKKFIISFCQVVMSDIPRVSSLCLFTCF